MCFFSEQLCCFVWLGSFRHDRASRKSRRCCASCYTIFQGAKCTVVVVYACTEASSSYNTYYLLSTLYYICTQNYEVGNRHGKTVDCDLRPVIQVLHIARVTSPRRRQAQQFFIHNYSKNRSNEALPGKQDCRKYLIR